MLISEKSLRADGTILVVDDEPDIREMIGGVLLDEGFRVVKASSSVDVERIFASIQPPPCMVVLDILLGDSPLNGMDLLAWLKEHHPDTQVMMISGHASIDLAVKATKMGASSFLAKPFGTQVLLHSINKGLKESRLRRENEHLRWIVGQGSSVFPGISPAARMMREAIARYGPTDTRVLLCGAIGCGKSLVARTIHLASHYADGPLLHVSCAGKPSEELISELFGAKAARNPRSVSLDELRGVYSTAMRGTIVLEDVDAIDDSCQAPLAQILSLITNAAPTDRHHKVRFLSTSRWDVQSMVDRGAYSRGLYERLAVSTLRIPSLNERLVDIPDLAFQAMKRAAAMVSRPPRKFTDMAVQVMCKHHWRGNLRELDSVMYKIMLSADVHVDAVDAPDLLEILKDRRLDEQQVAHQVTLESILQSPLKAARGRFERLYLHHHLTLSAGNVSNAARRIGMHRTALHRKLQNLGMDDLFSTTRVPVSEERSPER